MNYSNLDSQQYSDLLYSHSLRKKIVYIIPTEEDGQTIKEYSNQNENNLGENIEYFPILVSKEGKEEPEANTELLKAIKKAQKCPCFVLPDKYDKVLEEEQQKPYKELEAILKNKNHGYLKSVLNDKRLDKENGPKDFFTITETIKQRDLNGTPQNFIFDIESFWSEKKRLYKERNSASVFIPEFKEAFTNENIHRLIPSCFKGLNQVLGGGFRDGLYVMLGTTGSGKTSFCLELAQGIIREHKIPVLYFTLEMSAHELIAKMLSAQISKSSIPEKYYLSADKILDFANIDLRKLFPELERKTDKDIEKAREYIKGNLEKQTDKLEKEIIQKFYIYDSKEGQKGKLTAQDIKEITEEFIRETGEKPFVIVDYFQLLGKSKEQSELRLSELDKVADDAFILKDMTKCEKLGIPLLTISAIPRDKNEKPLGIDSARGSGMIEYTANVIFGLQPEGYFTISDTKEKEEFQKAMRENQKTGKGIVLEIVQPKNRFNIEGDQPRLLFKGKYSSFSDTELRNSNYIHSKTSNSMKGPEDFFKK